MLTGLLESIWKIFICFSLHQLCRKMGLKTLNDHILFHKYIVLLNMISKRIIMCKCINYWLTLHILKMKPFHYEYRIQECMYIVYTYIKSAFGQKSNCTKVNRFECTSSKMNSMLWIRRSPLFTGGDSWTILPCIIIIIWLSVNFYMGILGMWNRYLVLFSHAEVGIPSKWMC